MKASTCVLVASFFILNESSLANQQEQVPPSGLILYNQFNIDAAIPQLKLEAEKGNTESQYYLGEALRKRNRYMTSEAQHWYEAAASAGNIYAMIQLGRSTNDLCKKMNNCPPSEKTQAQWLTQAKILTLPQASNGDPESLFLMYEITLDHEWLEKSANAGYPLAQYWMAVSERQGEGFFFIPGNREESVRRWLKLSSEGGYPKAMNDYLVILYTEGDMESVRQWMKVAAETGEQEAVSNYGAYISHTPDKVGFPLDLIKGYALFSLLKELGDNGGIQDYVEQKIEKIGEKMTPEQIKESMRVAAQWKASHPPLSFFPDKLGD
ncbi:tetratricopeptide repeat protein [Pseudomonas sp. B35(2017)]|uniref:tetratricopeptide repeat protein n=1 Tax=Pseudomonas sp. B35(2017) TaxID=1981722 RepID=UPI000A1DE7C9|nr:sel1 repeat family protein [Pseudomonas sp. B35(2017)]